MTTLRKLLIAASIAILPAAGVLAQDGGADFGGDQTDPVTGYPCADRFCLTVRPNNDCLCQKLNPGEQTLANVRFACVGNVPAACPVLLLGN